MRHHDHGRDCGGTCQWRQLYEGTLQSNRDLNDKFLAALGRHGRLRNNMISTMRKAFPSLFLQAEKREKRRMADQPDEVLVRYLSMWLSSRPDTGLRADPGTAALRSALTDAGFVLPGDGDLHAWARAVTEQHRSGQHRAQAAGSGDGARAGRPLPRGDQGTDVVGVFDKHTEPRTVTAGEPIGPGPVDEDHPSAADDLASLFHDLIPDPDDASPPAGDGEQPDDAPKPATSEPATPSDAATSPAPSSPGDAADSPERTKKEASDGAKGNTSKPPLRPTLFPNSPAAGKTRRRKPKASTTASAQSPAPSSSEAEAGTSDDFHQKVLELVRRPQPLFTSDLVAAGLGSEEDVVAWERACRDDSDSPVRFIPPKSRHRDRGALVIPYSYAKSAPAEFKRSTWAQMLDRYRGARLYELSVVLHRVREDLMSADLHDNHVVLRLSQPRGLVGLLITTQADFDRGDDSRAEIVTSVEELLGNPLTLLGLLCTNHNALPHLVTAAEEEARERDWKPGFPVVAQRSFEYAADKGTSATLVLEG